MEDKNRRKPSGGGVQTRVVQGRAAGSVSDAATFYARFLGAVMIFLLVAALMREGPAEVSAADYQVKPFSQITTDSNGLRLRFPNALFYDHTTDETYVFTGGKAQIAIFDRDLFPLLTVGPGREIYTPQGGFVDRRGQVYVCQAPLNGKPARITVLNGALILVREILFDDIPDASNFIPKRVVVSEDGLIYVSSQHRGVLVLDNDGTFLRWLQPVDRLSKRRTTESETATQDPEQSGRPSIVSSKGEIPDEYRPRSEDPGIGPVLVTAISIDRAGNLYLVSNQTGKVYVYSADETFLFSFGTKGGTPGRLSQPRGVAVDPERKRMYVADYMRHTILVYDHKGEFLFEFGGKGDGPGWFRFPNDVTVNRDGQVVVADLFNHRLQVLEVRHWSKYPSVQDLIRPLQSEVIGEKGKAVPDVLPGPGVLEDNTGAPSEDGDEVREEVIPAETFQTFPLEESVGKSPQTGSAQ